MTWSEKKKGAEVKAAPNEKKKWFGGANKSSSTIIYKNLPKNMKDHIYIDINGKVPIDEGWNKPVHEGFLSYEEIQSNYGVLTGFHGLQVIDIDSSIAHEKLKDILPNTYTVKTGSEEEYKKHYYYYVNYPISEKVKDEKDRTLVDVLGLTKKGKYKMVVGPGSVHPDTGRKYYVENDSDIRGLSNLEWKDLLNIILSLGYKKENKTKLEKTGSNEDIFSFIKDNIDLKSFLFGQGERIPENKKIYCLQKSEKNPSLHIYDDSMYCYSCESHRSIIDYVMLKYGIDISDIPEWFKKNYPEEMKGWKEEPTGEMKKNQESKQVEAFSLLSVSDFMKIDIPEREDLLTPWLKEKSIIIVNAWRGVGKTHFVWGLVNSISKGLDFGVWEGHQSKCLICDGELTPEEIQERIPPHRLGKNVYIRSVIWEKDRKNYPGLLTNKTYRELIENTCLSNGIKLLVIDNKKSFTPGIEENSSNEWDEINEWLLELRGKGLSVILVTHSGKDEKRGIRGHSGIGDNVDFIINLADKQMDSDDVRFSYHFDKCRGKVELKYRKDRILTFRANEDNTYEWLLEDDTEMMLQHIKENPEKTQSELAHDLGISQAKVSRLKKKCE